MSCHLVLKQKGYRMTPQRKLILDILHNENSHVTAEDIFTRIKSQLDGVNISTVYRTLDLLESLGLVVKSEFENGHIYHHAEEGHHHHLTCQLCGQVQECAEDVLESLGATLKIKYGFEANLNHLVISGICSKCAKKQHLATGKYHNHSH